MPQACEEITKLANNPSIHGILIQLPLPKQLDTHRIWIFGQSICNIGLNFFSNYIAIHEYRATCCFLECCSHLNIML